MQAEAADKRAQRLAQELRQRQGPHEVQLERMAGVKVLLQQRDL